MLRSVGVEVESGLAFSAVQQLCAPLVDSVAELPPPQAEALGVALGLAPGPAPDPLLVGLGLASLLAVVASAQPVVCLIDDAEWVDESSAQAVGVASRRLGGIAVAFLVASGGSDSIPALQAIDTIRLHPLTPAESQLLLSLELPGRLDPSVRDRILEEGRGNPQVIGEFGRSTTVSALAGGFAVDACVELDPDISEHLGSLPADVATAMLLAATEPMGDPTVFRKALSSAGLPASVQRGAEATDLVQIGDRVLFRHPLVRHMVYRSASDGERRVAHRVLAESLDVAARPDHVSWHSAKSCAGLSEDMAESVERSSEAAGRAGGDAAAAAFLGQAAALSEEPGARIRRTLDAARLHCRSGGFDEALRLIAEVDQHDAGRCDSGWVALERLAAAEVAASIGRPHAASELLLTAERIAPTDPASSVAAHLAALDAATASGRFGPGGGMRHSARRAVSSISEVGPSAAGRLLHAAATWWGGGDGADRESLARAIAACRADESVAHPMATRVAMELCDERAGPTLAQRDVDQLRRSGSAARLPSALDLRACLHLLRGEVELGERSAGEAASIARRLGTAEPELARILLAGWRCTSGDELEWVDEWTRQAAGRADGAATTLLEYVRSLIHTASGRYEQARLEALLVFERDEPFVSTWAAPEVVEAAARSGRPEKAARALEHTRALSVATGSSWAAGIHERCAALLAEDDLAEEHFRVSIRHLEASGMRLDLARTQLVYGEWLRRQKRRVDARHPLRRALATFDAIGAGAFTTRASLELRASGEQARRRTPDTMIAFTDRERQIAELASEGHSNPAIGQLLYISSRTVEYHLHNVFSKLGITSRAQLRTVPELSRR